MKQILSGSDAVKILLGKQEIKNNEKFRFIKFLLFYKADGQYLIYNDLTKQLLLLTKQELDSVKICILKEQRNPLIDQLIREWFLVSDTFNELNLCEQVRIIVKNTRQIDYISNYNILTTTMCNAHCFYCYQAGANQSIMSSKIAEDVAEYIIKNNKGHTVRINWFGGEPLCNVKAIDIICRKLKKVNVKFYSVMTTNASLFNDELLERASDLWNLKWLQITVDGTCEKYDSIKNFKDKSKHNFNNVISNIEKICKKNIPIHLRMNMDKHNNSDLFDLADYLYEKFNKYENFTPYVNLLYENVGYVKTVRTNEERVLITRQYVKLCKYIESKFKRHRTMGFGELKVCACLADRKESVLISPNGDLGFCEHHVDDDFFGTIYDEIKKPAWCKYKSKAERCKRCPVYCSCLRLEKCPNAQHECYDYILYGKIRNIQFGMKKAYLDAVESGKIVDVVL